jgi:hypothetical protein
MNFDTLIKQIIVENNFTFEPKNIHRDDYDIVENKRRIETSNNMNNSIPNLLFKDFLHQTFTENYIKKTSNLPTWEKFLQNKGWVRAGDGRYAVVFHHPEKNYVLKLYRDDKSYDFFINFLLKNQQNSSVVKLKKIIYKTGKFNIWQGMNVIALEKLNEIPVGSKISNLIYRTSEHMVDFAEKFYKPNMTFEQLINTMINSLTQEVRSSQDRKGYDEKRARRLLHILQSPLIHKLPIFKTIFELLQYKIKYNIKSQWDLNDSNFMIRPSTGEIVLTDPFAN